MSWHISKAGRSAKVAELIERECEANARQSHNGPTAADLIRQSGRITCTFLKAIASTDPNRVAVVSLSGHIDSGGSGNITLDIKTHFSGETEPEWVTTILAKPEGATT